MGVYVIGGGFLGWLLSRLAKLRSATVSGAGGHPYPLPTDTGVPFAGGPARPAWPIGPNSTHKRRFEVAYRSKSGERYGNQSRRFKASRSGGARYHAGIDLYAHAGDLVVAPEDGVIVADQNFLNSIPGEDAMLIAGDSGTTILLGEIVAESMGEFGLSEGSRVRRGQPVARVALTKNGSHMLHFETYTAGAERNRSWKQGTPPHSTLRDPTAYLLRARASTGQPFP